jgi:hypothetical protein
MSFVHLSTFILIGMAVKPFLCWFLGGDENEFNVCITLF